MFQKVNQIFKKISKLSFKSKFSFQELNILTIAYDRFEALREL